MLNLGTVKPGSTIRIPFSSFDKDDGSSITMTNYAAADILVYKDGNATERASTSGFTATTDFDSKTGKHLAVIDLADNTTAGFWNAGSEYLVAIDAVTIDGVTVGGWIGRFTIGYPGANLDTTIATLSTQTGFTLTSGPAEDDALNGHWAIIHDIASGVQRATVLISDYVGSTKTVTLAAGATFAVAAGDNISVMDLAPLQPTVLGRALDVSAGGEAGLDWANIGSPTTAQNLSATNIDVDQVVASVSGAVGSVTGNVGGSVASVATGGITAGSIAADAIGASELATDAVTEIVNAVWAAAARTLTALDEDSTTLDLDATIQAAVGLAAANLDTQLSGIQSDTNDIQTRLPAALISGRIDATVGAMQANVITAAAAAADLTTELQTGLATSAALATVDSNVSAIKAKTDNLPGDPADASDIATATTAIFNRLGAPAGASVSADIAAVSAKIGTPTDLDGGGATLAGMAADIFGATGGSFPTAADIADAVWEEDLGDHSGTAGSTAEALAAAGGSGDPWITPLPGSYASGQAGKIVGDFLNATVSSRATQTSVDDLPTNAELATALGTADDAVLTQIALVKAKTDNLPADPADASDIAAAFAAVPSAAANAAAVLGATVEAGATVVQSLRLANSALGAIASGLETTAPKFRDLADTKDRITVTGADADGNRPAVTRDLT